MLNLLLNTLMPHLKILSMVRKSVFSWLFITVAKAHGMTVVAEKSGMARQAMYRAPETEQPRAFFIKLNLDAMGLKPVERKPRAS